MARKRKKESSGGASWLETYSDLVTLLLTFFILLYSMSTIDAQKYAVIAEAFSKGKIAVVGEQSQEQDSEAQEASMEGSSTSVVDNSKQAEDAAIDKLYESLSEYIKNENIEDSVQIEKNEEYVFIRFTDNIAFDGYSNKLNQSGDKILDVLAGGLNSVDKYIDEVIVAGHTAEVKSDTSVIDRSLSTERANNVVNYLQAKNVIDPSKYLAIGYGLYKPIADNSTAEGRAKNRRVEIYISRKGHAVGYTNKIQN